MFIMYNQQVSQAHILRAPMPGVVKSIACTEGNEVNCFMELWKGIIAICNLMCNWLILEMLSAFVINGC